MGKRVRKSTQIRMARKDAAQRKRVALESQAPRRQSKRGKGLDTLTAVALYEAKCPP